MKMKRPYAIFDTEEDDEGPYTLCLEVERGYKGALNMTCLRGPVAEDIRDMKTARLLAAAPSLLDACEKALTALNTAPNIKVPALYTDEKKYSSYDVAALLGKVIRFAKGEEDAGCT